MLEQKKSNEKKFSRTYLFNNYEKAREKYEDLVYHDNLPSHIFAVAYHRRF